jgi:hypothetical protein
MNCDVNLILIRGGRRPGVGGKLEKAGGVDLSAEFLSVRRR